MKKIITIIFMISILTGCAGMITKWECADHACISYDRATNKCLAQANAAFTKNKRAIWEQCMKGEGFKNRPCEQYELNSPDCKAFHVF